MALALVRSVSTPTKKENDEIKNAFVVQERVSVEFKVIQAHPRVMVVDVAAAAHAARRHTLHGTFMQNVAVGDVVTADGQWMTRDDFYAEKIVFGSKNATESLKKLCVRGEAHQDTKIGSLEVNVSEFVMQKKFLCLKPLEDFGEKEKPQITEKELAFIRSEFGEEIYEHVKTHNPHHLVIHQPFSGFHAHLEKFTWEKYLDTKLKVWIGNADVSRECGMDGVFFRVPKVFRLPSKKFEFEVGDTIPPKSVVCTPAPWRATRLDGQVFGVDGIRVVSPEQLVWLGKPLETVVFWVPPRPCVVVRAMDLIMARECAAHLIVIGITRAQVNETLTTHS